ncbi:MAG: YdcF family protein [Verrucomicrobiia bacterium]
MRKLIKRTALGIFLFLLLLVVAALVFPGLFLTVDSGPVKADVLVLLGGGSHERSERTAELFKEHVAPRIIISGAGDGEINRHLLVAAGVPANVIEMENQSKTTRENAQFTVPLLREQNLKRVILVTSWYHSRRALACFRHDAPEIMFFSRPSYFASARADWSHNRIGNRVRLEFVKLLGYWVRYGVSPF